MSRISFEKNLLWLRICTVVLLLSILSLFLLSFRPIVTNMAIIFKQLGITEVQGTEKIRNSFIYGYVDNYGIRKAGQLATENRLTIATGLINYSRTYLQTSAFKALYAKERAAAKPMEPTVETISKEDIRNEKIAQLQKNIRDAEDYVNKFPDMEKSVTKTIGNYQSSIKAYEAPDNPVIEMIYKGELETQQNKKLQYEKQLATWAQNYPENHTEKIKVYLQKYLDMGATVDFDAELVEKNGKQIFVNPDYEKKHKEWKMIYRAGKEVYDVVKPVATQWLSEL